MTTERQNLLLGIIVGGMAGAIAALLYAPQEGAQTREQIKDKARGARDKASNAVGTVKESAHNAGVKSREVIEGRRTQVREAIHAGRRAAADKRAELAGQSDGEPKASI
jgi:gas vesicle protein